MLVGRGGLDDHSNGDQMMGGTVGGVGRCSIAGGVVRCSITLKRY